MMSYAKPEQLVETGWLEEHLEDDRVRILDCNVILTPLEEGGFQLTSGRETWKSGHIPGSIVADLTSDLSDPGNTLPLMAPTMERFADAMSRYGVGPETRVILYDDFYNMWAARVWWMLRAVSFSNAAVLNGGWRKWALEHRPVSTDIPSFEPANFPAVRRANVMATKADVLTEIGKASSCIVNALSPEDHAGTGGMIKYPRPGRITSSVNVPFAALVDEDTHAYLPAASLRERFEAVETRGADRVITYCGAGIAACSDAFALTLLGKENVEVYDGSLMEWAAEASLPMERD